MRLDTNIHQHDKILDVLAEWPRDGHRTCWVYVCSLSFAGRNETDGLLVFSCLSLIHGRKVDAERLVSAELWAPHPRGFVIKNWAERQPSKDTTAQVRASRTAGAKKGNCLRWHGLDCGCWVE